MKYYDVKITELRTYFLSIEAETAEQAEQEILNRIVDGEVQADTAYFETEYVLDEQGREV